MEDNQYPTVKNSSKRFWWIIVAIALIIATGVIVFYNHDTITKIVEPKGETICTDTTFVVESVPTVQEILDFRKEIKEGERIDSMFLAIPDAILVDILMTHGTSLSNSDIVYIYESNKDRYNNILKGATIQKEILDNTYNKAPRDSLKRE